mgnify:CR=1 FL=1
MKTIVKEIEKERNYPYIGVCKTDKDLIILFTGEETGVTINGGQQYSAGDYSHEWVEPNFEPFEGVVELSND